MPDLTCFVIIGYDTKTDHNTGRLLNLENTYKSIIKPVFDDLGIKCFRAKDITHSGPIDTKMYEWILKANIVLADLSTLNPNVLYELGVRHALKPYTTIVISENKLTYPFDLNHIVIHPIYEHLGQDIGVQEADRFKKELKLKVGELLRNPEPDSPIYTYIKGLNEPTFTQKEIDEIVKGTEKSENTLSGIIETAEKAKRNSDFQSAIQLFELGQKLSPNDIFIKQRIILVTYKSKLPSEKEALINALKLLKQLYPDESTDPETLGLAGAIHKRLHELTNEKHYCKLSQWYYERGFYIKQDYYNGINAAFMYNVSAAMVSEIKEAITDFYMARRIRNKIVETCTKLIAEENFEQRGDKSWIFFTLAEAYLGLELMDKVDEIINRALRESEGSFDVKSFNEQKEKLEILIKKYREKWGNRE